LHWDNESTMPAQFGASVGERRHQADSRSSSGAALPCFSSASKSAACLVAGERSLVWRLPISTAPPLLLRRLNPKPAAPLPVGATVDRREGGADTNCDWLTVRG
jgi:hypothetical protein